MLSDCPNYRYRSTFGKEEINSSTLEPAFPLSDSYFNTSAGYLINYTAITSSSHLYINLINCDGLPPYSLPKITVRSPP